MIIIGRTAKYVSREQAIDHVAGYALHNDYSERAFQLERGGQQLSEQEKKELYESVKRTYDEQMDPRYGAARLWIDKIIDPVDTREAITTALEAAALNPDVPEFKVGVLQT